MSKLELTFTGEIVEVDGFHKMEIKNRSYYLTRIQKAPLGRYRIIVEEDKPKRSHNQNRFYWGVCLPLIAEETGEDDVEALHDLFKEKYLPTKYETVLGEEVKREKTTKNLSKAEFSEYLNKIERDTGVLFPDPHDAGFFCMKNSCIRCTNEIARIK